MTQELLTLFVLVVVLVTIFWTRRRSRAAVATPPGSGNELFRHESSPEVCERIAKRVFPDQDPDQLRTFFETYQFSFSKSGHFIFTPPEGTAAAIAQRMFPPAEASAALAALEKYRSQSGAADTELMRVHILKAAGGDGSRIASLVDKSKNDFRDVMASAHEPNVVELRSRGGQIEVGGPEYQEAAERDLRQYVLWLHKYSDHQH